MAGKTLINGTAYEIKGGRTLVNGTAYGISGGKTLVGGTAYKIEFGKYKYVNYIKTDGNSYLKIPNVYNGTTTNSGVFEASMDFALELPSSYSHARAIFAMNLNPLGSYTYGQQAFIFSDAQNFLIKKSAGVATIAPVTTTKGTYKFSMNNGYVYGYYNTTGNSVRTPNTENVTEKYSDKSLYVCNSNIRGYTTGAVGKIYNLIIKKSGSEVGNYLPAIRKADGVIGMYDSARDLFLTNAGTGSFTYG